MRGAVASGILAVWKRAAPRNRMREIFTSGSVGGLAEQSLVLPGHYSWESSGKGDWLSALNTLYRQLNVDALCLSPFYARDAS